MLFFPGWIAAAALLVAGSRWARPAIAVMILARFAVVYAVVYAWRAWQIPATGYNAIVVPLVMPLTPLVVLRVEEPRVVLALAALGRWREAVARSGGAVALLVALAVLSTYQGTCDAVWGSFRSDALCLPGIIVAFAAVVTWRARKRTSAVERVFVGLGVLLTLAVVVYSLRGVP